MKRVIVTGGTGFVGANLVRRLLHDGHQIHLLVRNGYSSWRIEAIRDDFSIHEVDLGNVEVLNKLVAEIKPDWVFHLAAYGAYSWQTDIHKIMQTNLTGTINLVNACLQTGFEAFINTGSSSEYGYKDTAPDETEWLEPNSHYAIMKAAATMFCRYTAQSKNMPIRTLRLYSVFGPYEEPQRLIPTLIVRGLRGELPPLVNPDIARDYIHVDDVSQAYLLAATVSRQELGAVYNVGTGIQTFLRDVVTAAREIMRIDDEPRWGSMPDRNWDTSIWVANNEKIRTSLNWHPKHIFKDGLQLVVNWIRQDPKMQRFYEKEIIDDQ
jgi:UDP-glucose 4-epimerase